jgi:hypothetical protein
LTLFAEEDTEVDDDERASVTRVNDELKDTGTYSII